MTRRTTATVAGGRVAVLVMLLFTTGCVYFNGVYNAKEAARNGDARLKRGDEAAASTFFATSAASAESVLARHPRSSWRERALYLSGRGLAMASYCDLAVVRLDEYLALPVRKRDSVEYNRARLARGLCDLRLGRIAEARAQLHELVSTRDPETARQARLWATRAALAMKDGAAAEQYLAGMPAGTMAWELMSASVAAREFTRVESLLVQRAREGEYRNEVVFALRELLNAGWFDGAERIVSGYDASRVRDRDRAAMHYLLGDQNLRAGNDSVAQRHLTMARQLAGADSVTRREAGARLVLMGMRLYENIGDLDSAYVQQDSSMLATVYSRRIYDQMLLMKLLAFRDDSTGAALFLAAEVARDSLRAERIARTLFLRVAREIPFSPVAPNAWYAASLLEPDSAAEWKERILTAHPRSNVAAWLRGEDPATADDFESTAELLRTTWTQASRAYIDTVRKMRGTRPGGGGQLP